MRTRSNHLLLVAVATLTIGAIASSFAFATDSFGGSFGGSFEDGSGVAETQPAPVPTPPPPPTEDNFGGSFETGSDSALPPPPPEPPAPDNSGGSWDTGSFAPEIAEPETPEPVVQPPDATPPPGPPVDPQIMAFESRDYGVPASSQLKQNNFHGPTPTSLPGGQVVSTQVLAGALQQGQQVILIDVLGSDYSLPNAYMAPALASGGSLNDRTQQQASQWLRQITGGNSSAIIVVYCSDPMCWLSYNAGLRTIAAGYPNVYWYRGGLKAWQMAGLPLYPATF